MLTLRRAAVICVAACLIVTISQFPFRLAIDLVSSPPFAAKDLRGTIWSGNMTGVTLSGFDLGDVTVRTNVLRLVFGKPATSIAWQSKRTSGTASAALEGGALALSDLAARVAVSSGAMPGIADISNAKVVFSGQKCMSADGSIEYMPTGKARGFDGQLTCNESVLFIKTQVEGLPVTLPLSGLQ
ncbi:MAG: type II secretion system protein N [Pseudomonadota bacterium]